MVHGHEEVVEKALFEAHFGDFSFGVKRIRMRYDWRIMDLRMSLMPPSTRLTCSSVLCLMTTPADGK